MMSTNHNKVWIMKHPTFNKLPNWTFPLTGAGTQDNSSQCVSNILHPHSVHILYVHDRQHFLEIVINHSTVSSYSECTEAAMTTREELEGTSLSLEYTQLDSCYRCGNGALDTCSCYRYGNGALDSCYCYGNGALDSCYCYGNGALNSCYCYGNGGLDRCYQYGSEACTHQVSRCAVWQVNLDKVGRQLPHLGHV